MNRLHATDSGFRSQLSELIVEHMNSGEKLPSEKEMMQSFHVSRSILREALSAYEVLGLIESQQGSGRYVKRPSLGSQIVDAWRIVISADPTRFLELLKVRSILEMGSVPKIMNSISISQLQTLNRVVAKMKACHSEDDGFAVYDREFHTVLMSAAGNMFIEQLIEAYWSIRDQFEYSKYSKVSIGILAAQHEEILSAIMHKDAQRAVDLLKEQFQDAEYQLVMNLTAAPDVVNHDQKISMENQA